MENNHLSPPPVFTPKKELLTFPDAIKAVIEGKTIQRESWPNKEEYAILVGDKLSLKKDGEFHQWLINDGDLLGTDWIVREN